MSGGGQWRGATSAGGHKGRIPFDGQAALFNRGPGPGRTNRGRACVGRGRVLVGVGGRVPCPASLSVRPRSHARSGFFKADIIISPGPFPRPSAINHRERPGGFARRVRRGLAWPGHARGGAGPTARVRCGAGACSQRWRPERTTASAPGITAPAEYAYLMSKSDPCAVRGRWMDGWIPWRGVGWWQAF